MSGDSRRTSRPSSRGEGPHTEAEGAGGSSSHSLSHGQQHQGNPADYPQGSGFVDGVLVNFGYAVQGFFDAFAWPSALITVYASPKIRTRAAQCFVLNGLIFVGSILLFNGVVVPLLHYLFDNPFFSLGSTEQEGQGGADTQPVSPFLKDILDRVLFGVYHIFWVYPIYTSSFILNSLWYQEIADEAYLVQIGKPANFDATYDSLVKRITDIIYELFLLLVYLLQAFGISFFPLFGRPISCVFFCWLYAFYSFEYKWMNQGWNLEKRLDYVETHWAYFAGFGFPGTLLTIFFPQFINSGIFALVFPMYIIMANQAVPLPKQLPRERNPYGSMLPTKMSIFSYAKRITLSFIKVTDSYVKRAIR